MLLICIGFEVYPQSHIFENSNVHTIYLFIQQMKLTWTTYLDKYCIILLVNWWWDSTVLLLCEKADNMWIFFNKCKGQKFYCPFPTNPIFEKLKKKFFLHKENTDPNFQISRKKKYCFSFKIFTFLFGTKQSFQLFFEMYKVMKFLNVSKPTLV